MTVFSQAHINGRKYKKAKAQEAAKQYNFAQHEPHIVQNRRDPRSLFCHRTKLHLNKVPEEVEIHVKGRRFRARLQEWEEKQVRRSALAARRDAKADDRAARKKAAEAANSDDEEDPVLAKFAHLNQDSEDEISSSDDEVPCADSDAEGEGEMDEARAGREHYAKGRLAAQAKAKQPAMPQEAAEEDDGSDFEVVAVAQNSGSESEDDKGADSSMEGEAEEEDLDFEPEPTAAKKLSIARHAAREERDAAAFKTSKVVEAKPRGAKPSKIAENKSKGTETTTITESKPKGATPPAREDEDLELSGEDLNAKDTVTDSLPAVWRHGAVVESKHHGRSTDRHHGRNRGVGGEGKPSATKGDTPIKHAAGGIVKKQSFSGGGGGGSRGGLGRGRGGRGR